MINLTTIAQATQWQALPLCERYLAVAFDDATMQVGDSGAPLEQTVCLVLGVLADGQCEVLSTWLKPEAGSTGWEDVFEDLRDRGVGKIRFVVAKERSQVRAGVPTAYSAATVLPATLQLLRQSMAQVAQRHRRLGSVALGAVREAETAQTALAAVNKLAASPWGTTYPAVVKRWRDVVEELGPYYALGTRLRRLIRTGDEVAQVLAQTLQRAVARHGCFPSEKAAITFVAEVLERANRRFGSAGPVLGRGSRSRVLRLGESSSLAGCH